MPWDYLSLQLPQFSLPTLREIKVASHVNYSLRSDFITEFARASVRPINEFQTDLQRAIPNKIGEDVSVPGVNMSKSVKPGASLQPIQTASGLLAQMIDTFEQDKDIYLDTTEFAQLLRSQFVEAGLYDQVRSLDRDIRLAHIEADTVISEAIGFDHKKWELLQDYLRYESISNAKLQHIIDTLRRDDVPQARQLVADIRSDMGVSDRALRKYQDFVGRDTGIQKPEERGSSRDDEIAGLRQTLDRKLSRMMADVAPAASPSSSPASLASGYSPHYQGVYIRTTRGVQTRLFDYTDPLTPSTRIDTLDIDQDGDLDRIYLLGGVLYIKYGWAQTPNKIQDTTVKISDIGATDPIPYIPDYFHEEISTPKNLNFSFTPSLTDETEWRMEFYDRYIEWDRVDIGTHIDASAPKALLDMFLAEPSIFSKNTGILATRVRRSLTSVTDPATWILAGRTIDVYTGALSISISPGRVLYTGKDAVTLTYQNANTPTPQTITLDPYTGYQWTTITEITTTGGRLYRIGSQIETARYTYSDDLIGIPILPGMRLYSSDR
jgi:hypothetical protein